MSYPYCTCGSLSLAWTPNGGEKVNAPFPEEVNEWTKLGEMKCIEGATYGSCPFCTTFRKEREKEFKEFLYVYVAAEKTNYSYKETIKAKEGSLKHAKSNLKKLQETIFPERKESYQKKFGRDPMDPPPEECSDHYTTKEYSRGCSGCWSSGYGIDGCNHPKGCQNKLYDLDHNGKCPKCQHKIVIQSSQASEIRYEEQIVVLTAELQELKKKKRHIQFQKAEDDALAALKANWSKHFEWLQNRLFPDGEEPPKKKKKSTSN